MAVSIAELFVTVGADTATALAGLNKVDGALKATAQSMQRVGGQLTAAVTLPVVAGATAIAAFGIGFEHSFTKVRKTVDGTEEELRSLQGELIALSASPLGGGKSAEELASIAAILGSMGIPIGNIAKMTELLAGFSVATGIAEEEAARALGGIALLTDTPIEQFDRLGSTIVDLGNKTAATEQEIIAHAERLAGALSAAGASAKEVVGISATLAELRLNPEAAGTALSRFFQEMVVQANSTAKAIQGDSKAMREMQDRISDLNTSLATAVAQQAQFGRNTPKSVVDANAAAIARYQRELAQANADLGKLSSTQKEGQTRLQAYAKVTGLSADEFRNLANSDPTAAFQAIVNGLSRIQDKATRFNLLEEIGIVDARELAVFNALANAPEKLSSNLDIANTAWEENNALQTEVQKAMEDTTNQWNLLVNEIKAQFIPLWQNELKPLFTDFVSFVRSDVIPKIHELTTAFADAGPEMQKQLLFWTGLVVAIGPTIAILGTVIGILGILLNPIAAVVIAIGILAAAWVNNWGDIQGKTAAVVDFIKRSMEDLALSMRRLQSTLAGVLVAIFESMGKALPGDLGKPFLQAADAVKDYKRQIDALLGAETTALNLSRAPVDTQAAVAASAMGVSHPEAMIAATRPIPPEVALSAAGQKFPELGAEFNAPVLQINGDVNVRSEGDIQALADQTAAAVLSAMIESERASTTPGGTPLPGAPFGAAQPTPI